MHNTIKPKKDINLMNQLVYNYCTKRDSEENTFIHTIHIKGNNKVCAIAKTVWKKVSNG